MSISAAAASGKMKTGRFRKADLDKSSFDYETVYFWRVDTRNAANTATGNVWSFKTEVLPLPDMVTTPNPANGVVNVPVNADISWSAANGADYYDVYFGKHEITKKDQVYVARMDGTVMLIFFAIFLYYAYELFTSSKNRRGKRVEKKSKIEIQKHSNLIITLMILGGLIALYFGGRWNHRTTQLFLFSFD